MLSVKGIFQNGLAKPIEPVQAHDGQSVIITFLEAERSTQPQSMDDAAWDEFDKILEECKIETGIADLAHQHDHYIHGTPKREPYP